MKKHFLIFCFFALTSLLFAQHPSIHQEQAAHYKAMGQKTVAQYDSLQRFGGRLHLDYTTGTLQKRVFGYHPYWMGSSWQNYRWDLLSDLCYFSYDTDPATGNPTTTNGFETAEVVDTALAHGVRVHLCVTLFSGHATFFGNPQAQQNLTANLITLVIQRGIQGINIDFEAVPSSQQQALSSYLLQLSDALHTSVPEAELSIAAPAVNWNNTFDIPVIAPALDFIMIMAYDYYWSGSSLAGPVAGYWPLTGSFNYAVNHSLSYYQGQGVPAEKLLTGLPYYGREWPVGSNTLPASTTGSGTAVTYRNVRNNSSGHYTPQNLYWDHFSFNPYYSYFSSSWRQCFFDDERSLGAKYDLINRRNTGGIGIWALGYDDGYPELWNLIEEKFTQAPQVPCTDTLFDTGGPWWNHGDREAYSETIQTAYGGPLSLHFPEFSLESGYDSLWIYDGTDSNSPLLAALSGNLMPEPVFTTGNSFTLVFSSDGATTRAGYALVWSCPTAAVEKMNVPAVMVGPNPASDLLYIKFLQNADRECTIRLLDISGQLIKKIKRLDQDDTTLDVSTLKPGIYLLEVRSGMSVSTRKIAIE